MITLSSYKSFGQEKAIYVGIDGRFNKYYTFIEVLNEEAFVEIMNEPKSGLVRKLYDEKISKGNNTFSPYKSDRIEINADFTKMSFFTLDGDQKTIHTIDLRPFKDDIQIIDAERNKAYFNDKSTRDIQLLDSVIGKGNYLETSYYKYIEMYRSDEKDASFRHQNFVDSLNHLSDIATSKIINRDISTIEFLNSYLSKETYTKEEIELFLKKSNFDKLSEIKVLTQIVERSNETLLGYLDESKLLLNSNNSLKKAFKDISFNKLYKVYYKHIKHSLKGVQIISESKQTIKKIMQKSKAKKIVYRTLPFIGYGVAIYFIITLI